MQEKVWHFNLLTSVSIDATVGWTNFIDRRARRQSRSSVRQIARAMRDILRGDADVQPVYWRLIAVTGMSRA